MPNIEAMTGFEGSCSIVIDDHVMKAFSVERNRPFYLKYKNASSVTLKRIADGDIADLMSCFADIQHLTMKDMKILNSISGVPRSLKNLTLINVKIEGKLFEQLLLKNKDTLKYLHLNETHTKVSNTSIYDLEELCPNLTTLIVKPILSNLDIIKRGPLKIITEKNPIFIGKMPNKLEALHIEEIWEHLGIEKLTKLRYLTVKDWSGGKIPPTVEHLKILNPIDKSFKKDLNNLKIKCLYGNYSKCSLFNVPKSNLDRYHLVVNSDTPRVLREDPETWKDFAPFYEKLTIENSVNDDLLWMLPYCTGLKEVALLHMDCTEDFLTKLSIQLIRNNNQMAGLKMLSVDTNLDLTCILNLLHRNKDTLEVL